MLAAYGHLRPEVRESVEPSGRRDCEGTGGVEGEEVDTGLSVDSDVRPNVELGERGEARDGVCPASAQAGESKRRHADPGATLQLIEWKLRRHMGPYLSGGHVPVREEEVLPRLRHDPWAVRKRPGAVFYRLEGRVLPRWRGDEVDERVEHRQLHPRAETKGSGTQFA